MKVGKLIEELDKIRYPGEGKIKDISDWDVYIEHTDQTFDYLKNSGWKTEEVMEMDIPWHFVEVDEMCGFWFNEDKKRIYLQINF